MTGVQTCALPISDQGGELAVGQDRQLHRPVAGLADPLVLVEGRDAAGVVADHDVGLGLLDGDPHLAVDREGAGELALRDDVAEAEAAAVVPGRIIDDLGAERFHDAGGHRDPVAAQDVVVVDRVLGDHLVDMAGWVDGRADMAAIDDLVLLDEPLSNVDAKVRDQLRRELVEMQREINFSAIYVTHDQIEAMTLADRVVVMEKGVVQQVGSPTEIYDRPANTFVAGFIGSPAMNLIEGQLLGGSFNAQHTEISGLPAPDGLTTLGFRAEDAEVVAAGGEQG